MSYTDSEVKVKINHPGQIFGLGCEETIWLCAYLWKFELLILANENIAVIYV